MLAKKLRFSPLVALIFALGTGSIGVKAMLFSSAATPTGQIRIITRNYNDGNKGIGNVEIHVEALNGSACPDRNETSDYSSNSVLFTACPTAVDGSAKQYYVSYVKRDGFSFRSIHGPLIYHADGQSTDQKARFYVKKGVTTNLEIWMNDLTPPPPPPPSPSPSPGPAPAPSSDNKNGRIQLTSYIYNADGSRTRIGNTTAHVQAVGFATTDVAHNCTVYNKTTDSAGGSVQANSNYGQAHFTSCWSGSEGKKAYRLSYLEIPSGYSFKSFHMTSGSFTNGGAASQNAQEYFNVLKDQETRVEVWMTKIPIPTAPATGGATGGSPSAPTSGSPTTAPVTTGGAVHQVITGSGTTYTAANNKPASQALAEALNAVALPTHAVLAPAQLDPDPPDQDEEDEDGDKIPPAPTAPNNLKAVQDVTGSIALSWEAPSGNPPNLNYTIERIAEGNTDTSELDSVDGLSWLDDSEDLEYPKNYTYRVYAVDLDDQNSSPVSAQITTSPIKTNVPPAPPPNAGVENNGQQAENKPPATQVGNENNTVTVSVPQSSNEEGMACGVVSGEGRANDLLEESGESEADASRMLCREEDGDVVEQFDEDVEFSLEFDEDELSDDAALYGYDGTDWEEIKTEDVASENEQTSGKSSAENRGNIQYASAKKVKGKKTKYKVKSRSPLTLAVIDKKDPSKTKAYVVGAGILSLVSLGGAFMIRRQLELNARRIPYGDIDLVAHLPGPANGEDKKHV